ncbi:MAG: hypothetical protein R3F17_04460 [Planctomycetota bacterium]
MDVFSSNVEIARCLRRATYAPKPARDAQGGAGTRGVQGATNLFDSLRGIGADLRADDGDNTPEMAV